MLSSAPYRMLCIRKMPPDRHHQDRVRRGVRRSQLHSASAEAAKAPYPLAPSSFPNCDRFAGSQFGDTGALPVLHGPLSFLGRLKPFFSFWQRKKRMGSKKLPQSPLATAPICQPNRNPMKWFRFGKEEGGCGYGVFAAPAETECSRLLLTQRGPLRAGNARPYRMLRIRKIKCPPFRTSP